MKKTLLIIVCLALVALAADSIYRVSQAPEGQASQPSIATSTVESEGIVTSYIPPTADSAPSGSHTYTNAEYGFSLMYPEELGVSDRQEEGNAHTTTFESVDGNKGFQIYIRPYGEDQITASQIQADTQGTGRGVPQEAFIGGGIRALIFYSNNAILGELREVWFMYDGYLFEVTTYKELDTWLAEIMKTWKFL